MSHAGTRTIRKVPRTDRASRLIAASPDDVYAALVDAKALMAWLPPTGMTGAFERFDPRPGGSYRLVLTYADASASPGRSRGRAGLLAGEPREVPRGIGAHVRVFRSGLSHLDAREYQHCRDKSLNHRSAVWRPFGVRDALRLRPPAEGTRLRSIYLERGGQNHTIASSSSEDRSRARGSCACCVSPLELWRMLHRDLGFGGKPPRPRGASALTVEIADRCRPLSRPVPHTHAEPGGHVPDGDHERDPPDGSSEVRLDEPDQQPDDCQQTDRHDYLRPGIAPSAKVWSRVAHLQTPPSHLIGLYDCEWASPLQRWIQAPKHRESETVAVLAPSRLTSNAMTQPA